MQYVRLGDSGFVPGDIVKMEGFDSIEYCVRRGGEPDEIWAEEIDGQGWISQDAIVRKVIKGGQNPKQVFGDKKPPLALIPLSADIEESLALFDGEGKYGFFNWRDNPIEAMTYVHAAIRHLKLWAMGDERTRDTNIHNLGAVKACCTILMDAQINGTMIDNRSKSPAVCDMLHEAEKNIEELKKLHEERLTKK